MSKKSISQLLKEEKKIFGSGWTRGIDKSRDFTYERKGRNLIPLKNGKRIGDVAGQVC